MASDDDDWRLAGQEDYLKDAVLVWRAWSAPPLSETRAWRLADGTVMETPDPDAEPPPDAVEQVEPRGWDHDHCDFCWAKFMATDYPPEQREWREQHPEILTAGYTPAGSEPGRTCLWICPQCFEDFRERFDWTVVEDRHAD